ncbi:MAG: prepilin peptidase [Alphaproteobacteria bacterium]|nr:prepilin peptidase [Alphaproteobacteria bacterium]
MDMPLAHNFILALAGILMIYAAGSDAARFRIPNMSCLAILALFPLFVLTAPTTVPWLKHLAVFGLVFVAGYVLFLKNIAGAGDIKLIAVIALWAGPTYCAHFLFITAISGGILSLGIGAATLIRRHLSKTKEGPALRQTPIPYGVAIAVGGLCTLALLSHPDLLQAQI